jgi:hypothetical protein
MDISNGTLQVVDNDSEMMTDIPSSVWRFSGFAERDMVAKRTEQTAGHDRCRFRLLGGLMERQIRKNFRLLKLRQD